MDGKKTDPPFSAIFIPHSFFASFVFGHCRALWEDDWKEREKGDSIARSCYISLFFLSSLHLSAHLSLFSSTAPVKCRRGCGIEREMERQRGGWRARIGREGWLSFRTLACWECQHSSISLPPSHHSFHPSLSVFLPTGHCNYTIKTLQPESIIASSCVWEREKENIKDQKEKKTCVCA